MIPDVIDPPAAAGEPVFEAMLKSEASDFRVSENLSIDFSGHGEHLYLLIEKIAMNTDEVVELLQRCYSVNSTDIGCCGLKDRHAVASQWFSIRTRKDIAVFENTAGIFNQMQTDEATGYEGYTKSLRILDSRRHSRKLKRGAHDGNEFALVLRQIQVSDGLTTATLQKLVAARLDVLSQNGFPNYIGVQRFGRGAMNIQRARQWFAHPRKRCSRAQRSLWLSSARSALFNIVCAARVREGSWQRLLEGEPASLNGSRSFFMENELKSATEQEKLEQRLAVFDIHPSAPWWGRGKTLAAGACAEFESPLLATYQDLCEGLERAGLAQERRAVRAIADGLSYRWLGDDELELRFRLSPGVFATTFLREICCYKEPQR